MVGKLVTNFCGVGSDRIYVGLLVGLVGSLALWPTEKVLVS